eukprot:CAMPEP_0184680596 /NCGR_PEP_ID=MMETSP0312-20130426/3493_1 /TAXON_ID=31354 /ORGANISM="Compsopogon coeruleus, Strain SAG 36.94" /LENGTH=84 /DNA_ID=CAMNT_0027130829 /DNA_START=83 /DNA_END=337 /DNA_ORIENTATION=-
MAAEVVPRASEPGSQYHTLVGDAGHEVRHLGCCFSSNLDVVVPSCRVGRHSHQFTSQVGESQEVVHEGELDSIPHVRVELAPRL